jgi:hypothetical protein
MNPKIRNIIILIAIAAVLILIYIFVIKPSPDQDNLVSSAPLPSVNNFETGTSTANEASLVDKDFLPLLLNAKNIKLNDAIFSDLAFNSLNDSSIPLVLDGTEGRPNPFAQFGNDPVVIIPVSCTLPQILDPLTNTCVTPSPTCTLPQILNPSTNTCVTPVTCVLPKVLDTLTNTCVTPPPPAQ